MLRGKKVWLTMQQRMNVLKDLETYPIPCVAEKYSVHPKTIKRIQERAAEIYNLAEKGKEEKRRKNFRQAKYEDLEERLYVWFTERSCLGETVSDALLLQKTRELKEEFGTSSNFKLSIGWLKKFKRRRHIRLVRLYDEKASADEDGANSFVHNLKDCSDEERRFSVEEGNEEWAAEEGDEERAAEKGDEEGAAEVGDEERAVEEGDEERATEKGDEERAAEEGDEERAAEEREGERAAEEGDEERAAEEGDEERAAEEGDEERATEEGDQVNGIELPSKIREDFEILFKQFKPLKKYLPPPARYQLEALKLTVLGYTTSKKRKLP